MLLDLGPTQGAVKVEGRRDERHMSKRLGCVLNPSAPYSVYPVHDKRGCLLLGLHHPQRSLRSKVPRLTVSHHYSNQKEGKTGK